MRPADASALIFTLSALTACAGGAPASVSSEPAPGASGEEIAAPASRRPTTVQPGAPGQAGRTLESSDLSTVDEVGYSVHDVQFMQGMIPHHAQALDMTALVEDRTADAGFRRLALRMEISQRDEIQLMSRWLELRDESVPSLATHEDHGGHNGTLMPGMLSVEQMDQLRAASGVQFERLFLEFMIQHHEGAIQMVAGLFGSQGGGQESEVFQFATDVDVDQRMEIERMRRMWDERR